jgi:hypothetical protein
VTVIDPLGRLGVEPPDGKLGNDGAVGSEGMGNEVRPGSEVRLGSDGALGSDGVLGSDGALGNDGTPGSDGALGNDGAVGNDGTLGNPEGPVTQAVTPLLDARTDAPPAGVVAEPPPEAETAPLGSEGALGVLTHCGPDGRDVGMDVGRVGVVEDAAGMETGAAACWVLAPLGKALAATAAAASTPAAPAPKRTIRP